MSGADGALAAALDRLRPVDDDAATKAAARQDLLTKPRGALGRLEALSVQLAAIARVCPPPIPAPATVVVFAGDHGVLEEGVSPWPAEVTAQMVANFVGGGAAVNVLARHAGIDVRVVDIGVASALAGAPGLISAKVRAGTSNLRHGPAMTRAEATAALNIGAGLATDLVERGARCLLTGDMGIGNTTPSAALIAACTGRPAPEVTGRGTGIDDERLAAKVAVIADALARHAASPSPDAVDTLASLGGFEIAGLAGLVVGGAAKGVPVVLDGVVSLAAAVIAAALAPASVGYMIAGHRSTEPAASIALAHLGLAPVIDLELRLGEGTGACLALPVVQAAAKILSEMATFESAGVTDEHE